MKKKKFNLKFVLKSLKIAVAIFFLFHPILLSAPEVPKYQGETEKFLKTIIDGNVDKAYDDLFKDSPILKLKPQAIDITKQQTHLLIGLYGKRLNFELIKKQDYGSSVIRLIYIIKTENIPIAFEIYFYKPYDQWLPASVNFEDTFALLSD